MYVIPINLFIKVFVGFEFSFSCKNHFFSCEYNFFKIIQCRIFCDMLDNFIGKRSSFRLERKIYLHQSVLLLKQHDGVLIINQLLHH